MNSAEPLKEIEDNLKQLAQETDEFKKSAFFQSYLDTVSKFWNYSYRNQLLIHYQMPNASRVAGFRSWQELGRRVTKGSKAIKILAPYINKVREISPETQKEVEVARTFFYPVSVFDLSQTEGAPLPDIDLTVSGDNYGAFLDALLKFCAGKNIKVDFKNLGVNGVYGYSAGGQIVLAEGHSINTQVNTLIHEIAHELLHANPGSRSMPRQQMEIQAEAVAYVVTKHFALENRSFNYLALYDADHKKIMENLQAVAEASREVIWGRKTCVHYPYSPNIN